jgi:hypothetical protein
VIVDRLDLFLLHVVPEIAELFLTALLAAGDLFLCKLSSVGLGLLLLISELLEDEHLALLVRGELFVLLAVQRGEG